MILNISLFLIISINQSKSTILEASEEFTPLTTQAISLMLISQILSKFLVSITSISFSTSTSTFFVLVFLVEVTVILGSDSTLSFKSFLTCDCFSIISNCFLIFSLLAFISSNFLTSTSSATLSTKSL